MRSKLILATVLISVWVCATSVVGSQIPLASYEYHVEGGGASNYPPTDPWAVAFILQLGFHDWEPYPEVRALGTEVRWREGDGGTVSFNSDNSDAFTDFALYATNGTEDQIRFWELADGFGGNGSPLIPESYVFKGNPDLIDHHLTMVDLTVDSLRFEPWNPPWAPHLEGFLYSADVKWQFYGVPIPEPTNMMAVIAVAPIAFRRLRRPRCRA